MSVIFKLKSDKVNKIKNMKAYDFLEYMGNNYEFTMVDDDSLYADEKVEDNVLKLGSFGYSSRGFEFSCEENEFVVRINTPSTSKDWKLCLNFIEELKGKTDSTVYDENGELIDDIENINYEQDILYGIKSIHENLTEYKSMTLMGDDRSIEISKEMMDSVINSSDVILAFDEMLEKVFYSKAYFAKQEFYKSSMNEVVGIYTIGDGYDFVLPLVPRLDYYNRYIEEEYGKVSNWILLVQFGNMNKAPLHLDYLENISNFKDFVKLDNNQIEISEKTVDELIEIFKG